MSATISYLTTIRFGDDALDDLANELVQLGVAAPLIVTDAGLTASGLVTRVQEAIGSDYQIGELKDMDERFGKIVEQAGLAE